jgi:hypothetical protein
MKTLKLVAVLLAALLPTMAWAASDMFLQIKLDKGESVIVQCSNGACATGPLAAGTWTVSVCSERGKLIPTNLALEYAIVGPRDSASGQASGKRQHGAITIHMEVSRAAPTNSITIEEAGTQLALGTTSAGVEAAQVKIGKSRSNIQNN